MAWTNNLSNIHVEKVEEVVDTNPELYLERMEHFISLKEYEQALEECEFYRKLGGDREVYNANCQRIKDIRDGKIKPFTETEKRILAIAEDVIDKKIHATPDLTLDQIMRSVDADSLDLFQISMFIEEEFGIEISNEEVDIMEQWTLRRVSNFVDRKRGVVSTEATASVSSNEQPDLKSKENPVGQLKTSRKNKEINEEREKYNQILNKDGSNIKALYNLARIEAALGNNKKAVEYLKRLDKLVDGKDKIQVYLSLGNLYKQDGDVEEAIKCYQNIYAADITCANGICKLARLYYEEKKDIKSAIQILNECFNKNANTKLKIKYLYETLRAVRVLNNPAYENVEANLYKRLEAFRTENAEQNLLNATTIVECMKDTIDRQDFECLDKLINIYGAYGGNAELNEWIVAYREIADFLKKEQLHEATKIYLRKEWGKTSKEKFGRYILNEAEVIKDSLEEIKKSAPTYCKLMKEISAFEVILNDNLQESKEFTKLSRDRALSPHIKRIMEYILLEEYICYEDVQQEFEREKTLFFEKEDKALYQHTLNKMQEFYPVCYGKFLDCFSYDLGNGFEQAEVDLVHSDTTGKRTIKVKKEDWKKYHSFRNAIISCMVVCVCSYLASVDEVWIDFYYTIASCGIGCIMVFLWFGLLRLIYKQATTKRLWEITGILALCIFIVAITLTGIGAVSWVILGRTVISGIKGLWPTDDDLGLVEVELDT